MLSSASKLFDLQGRVALVTGGTTGIGRRAAELFHEAGARVAITGHTPRSLQQARDDLGSAFTIIAADARSAADTERLIGDMQDHFSRVDILFLNAGIAQIGSLEVSDEAFYKAHMDCNVKGVVLTLRKLLPLLRSGSSVIINTSFAASRGVANFGVYSATKGALSALVRSLAVELADRGIRVNAVAPGPIETPIQSKFGLDSDTAAAVRSHWAERIPLGRYGAADEVASAVLFLASEAASYITGVELPVDGGLSIA